MSADVYAGDISPLDTFEALKSEADAVLVDVRTMPEWQFVGVPDLESLGKQALFVEWQSYPEMKVNADFAEQVVAKGVAPSQPVYLICRSGVRSKAAAKALTAAGFETCYNVRDGFEGPHDKAGHRGLTAGWKRAGLPWRQQ